MAAFNISLFMRDKHIVNAIGGGGLGVIFASDAEMKVPIAGVSTLFTE